MDRDIKTTPLRNEETGTQYMTHLDHFDPDVKSYVYQAISEFTPYLTPNTIVAVIAKDPVRLVKKLKEEGHDVDEEQLSKMFRISISLTEDGTKIEEEALHENIFEAIRQAKDKLMKNLAEIQNSVISNSERAQQIQDAKNFILH
jgi:ribosome-associated translation inhibitor RaiA